MADNDQAVSNVQTKVEQLLQEANPNISEEVKRNVIRGASQQASEIFQMMKEDPSLGSCGVIAGIFKDKADKDYGGYLISFDKQGNARLANPDPEKGQATIAFKPGDSKMGILNQIIESDPDAKQNLDNGYRDVRSSWIGCAPSAPKP